MEAFNLNGFNYTCTRPGYYYRGVNGVNTRISQGEYEKAKKEQGSTNKGFDLKAIAKDVADGILAQGVDFKTRQEVLDYAVQFGWDAEIDEFGPEFIYKRTDDEDEQLTGLIAKHICSTLPKEKRPRRQVAHRSASGETLTSKQVDFLRRLPKSDFWEKGIDSILWVDCLADTIGGQFDNKPMTIGAMVSTLNEKGVIEVTTARVQGKKARSFVLTEKGKVIAKELGIK